MTTLGGNRMSGNPSQAACGASRPRGVSRAPWEWPSCCDCIHGDGRGRCRYTRVSIHRFRKPPGVGCCGYYRSLDGETLRQRVELAVRAVRAAAPRAGRSRTS